MPMRSLAFRPLLLSYVENILGDARYPVLPPLPTGEGNWNACRLYEALVHA